MTSNKTLACRTHKHTPTYRMIFSRICGFSFASAATDVVVTVFALVVAVLVAAVDAGHVLHFHVVVGDVAHKAIAKSGGTTKSLGARENL